jgi:hypothetical protein
MICEHCFGNGYVLRHFSSDSGPVLQHFPCPDCIGGVSHCCEGEQWSEREIEIEQVKK